MLDVSTLRQVFNEKLEKTGSMDAAFTKAVWVAYQKGVEDASCQDKSQSDILRDLFLQKYKQYKDLAGKRYKSEPRVLVGVIEKDKS